jgi:ATP-dependent Lon protease
MSRELPIFPLPLVLFPGATQPLHIFEPRYRQLLADVLGDDRRFGVAYVAPLAGPGLDPALQPGAVGCVALINAANALPDGRSNIVTVGERRFTLLDWVARGTPYRVGRVEEFEDDPADAAEAGDLGRDVQQDFRRLARALGTLTDRPEHDLGLADDPQHLSFQVAAALELDGESKQELLALTSTTDRLRRLAALLGPLAEDAERRAAVRERGRRNGRGGKHPPPQIEHAT